MKLTRGRTLAACGAVLLGGALMAIGGPFLNAPAPLPDEVRALGELRQVHLVVDPLAPALVEAGIEREAVYEQAARLLAEGGLELAEDAPTLVLKSAAMTEPSIRDAVAFVFFMDFVQAVRVLRLGEDLVVPTTTVPAYGMVRKGRLAEAVTDAVERGIAVFLDLERQASRRH